MKKSGITLIALVITIIVLLILAGITISLTIGQGGILDRAQEAGLKNAEAQARQKLELALLDLQSDKVMNASYNENEYIDNYLINKQMQLIDDIVLVDGWQFQIDRSEPEIIVSLGKGEESKEITLIANVENATDYTKASINIEISYDGEISSIQINGKEEQIPTKTDGKYIITKEVLENGTYTVLVKDSNDNYKSKTIKVSDISEDLVINKLEELISFRDGVNKGRTYEGKKVSLNKDINVNEGKYSINSDGTIEFSNDAQQWIPIGTTNNTFKGTFDGNNHIIKGIYINDSTKADQGLFCRNYGDIKNVIVEEGSIVAAYRIGGIVGSNYGKIESTINRINLESTSVTAKQNSCVGGIAGYAEAGILRNNTNYGKIIGVGGMVGGICGVVIDMAEPIYNCKNLSEYVKTTGANANGYSFIGGIIGRESGSNIEQCYNTADVIGTKATVGGIVGQSTGTVINSYNTGDIESLGVNDNGHNNIGGIVGFAANTVSDCYNTGNVTGTKKSIGGIVGNNNKVSGVTIKQELLNCYNTGLIGVSTAAYRGGVVGIGASTSKCYYLSGQASYGVGGSTATAGNNTNAAYKTKTELQGLAATLGDNWIADGKIKNENGEWVDNLDKNGNIIYINDRYPILKWQVEE